MFEIKNTFSFNKDSLTDGNDYDYVTRTSINQGILQKTGFINKNNINQEGVWSLGLLQMDFFYRKRKWYAGQFVRKIVPNFKLNMYSISFFTSLLNKQKNILLNVLVRDVDKIFSNITIQLPIKDNQIDFDFMESFIAELEAERIAELEAYLKATGLNKYELTEQEKQALDYFEKNNVEWGEFRIGDLFEKVDTNNVIKNDLGDLPATTAILSNNQIGKYISRNNATILKNIFSATANGFGKVFYQPNEFTVLQDSYAFKFKNTAIKIERIHSFITSALNKIYVKYDWGNKSGWNKIKNNYIQLPIKDNQIDFDFMESFITAIQKLVIKDVVIYADRKIKATNKL